MKIIPLIAILALLGCNALSRKYGGDMTQKVDCGRKVVNVTWKDSDLWVLTRQMRSDETPETYVFTENSNLGLVEGAVTVIECRK